jgi:hypothetical protein
MHLHSKTGWLLAASCAVLLGASGEAQAATGVVFVHGTSDQSVSSATSGYWTQAGIDSMRNGQPYLVVGYPGARCAGYLAGIATLFLGFLWIGFDHEKRGLQDWIAGTYVIRV